MRRGWEERERERERERDRARARERERESEMYEPFQAHFIQRFADDTLGMHLAS